VTSHDPDQHHPAPTAALNPRRYPVSTEHTPENLLALPWRTGRRVGRTVYAQIGPDPSGDDVLIGVLDHPRLAADAVDTHNAARLERLGIPT
jgi:hypothetical protein